MFDPGKAGRNEIQLELPAGLESGSGDARRLWRHYRSPRFLDRQGSLTRTYREHT
jgi:hypothetical protein